MANNANKYIYNNVFFFIIIIFVTLICSLLFTVCSLFLAFVRFVRLFAVCSLFLVFVRFVRLFASRPCLAWVPALAKPEHIPIEEVPLGRLYSIPSTMEAIQPIAREAIEAIQHPRLIRVVSTRPSGRPC